MALSQVQSTLVRDGPGEIEVVTFNDAVLDPGSYELFVQLHGHAGLSNAGAAPDEHHLAVERHTESLRPERDGCLLFIVHPACRIGLRRSPVVQNRRVPT